MHVYLTSELHFVTDLLKLIEVKRTSKLPASVATSPIKIASESDHVTPTAEETLNFDEDTLRGEEK